MHPESLGCASHPESPGTSVHLEPVTTMVGTKMHSSSISLQTSKKKETKIVEIYGMTSSTHILLKVIVACINKKTSAHDKDTKSVKHIKQKSYPRYVWLEAKKTMFFTIICLRKIAIKLMIILTAQIHYQQIETFKITWREQRQDACLPLQCRQNEFEWYLVPNCQIAVSK